MRRTVIDGAFGLILCRMESRRWDRHLGTGYLAVHSSARSLLAASPNTVSLLFLSMLSSAYPPDIATTSRQHHGRSIATFPLDAVFDMEEGFSRCSPRYLFPPARLLLSMFSSKKTFNSLSVRRVSLRRSLSELSRVICAGTPFAVPFQRAHFH